VPFINENKNTKEEPGVNCPSSANVLNPGHLHCKYSINLANK
jgi:hypothetical protein